MSGNTITLCWLIERTLLTNKWGMDFSISEIVAVLPEKSSCTKFGRPTLSFTILQYLKKGLVKKTKCIF